MRRTGQKECVAGHPYLQPEAEGEGEGEGKAAFHAGAGLEQGPTRSLRHKKSDTSAGVFSKYSHTDGRVAGSSTPKKERLYDARSGSEEEVGGLCSVFCQERDTFLVA